MQYGTEYAAHDGAAPLGGRSTPGCGGAGAGRHGRRRNSKKTPAWKPVFFCFFSAPDHGAGAAPPPLSCCIVGLLRKPHLFSLGGGSLAARGRNNGGRPCPAARPGETSGLRGLGRAYDAPLHVWLSLSLEGYAALGGASLHEEV